MYKLEIIIMPTGIVHTTEIVSAAIAKTGHTWVDGVYTNNRSKLKLKCANGHVFSTSLSKIQIKEKKIKKGVEKHICYECYKATKVFTKEAVVVKAKGLGYEILNIEGYKNEGTILDLKCLKGHTTHRRWSNVKEYPDCKICRTTSLSWVEVIKPYAEQRGFRVIRSSGPTKVVVHIGNAQRVLSFSQMQKILGLTLEQMWNYKIGEPKIVLGKREDRAPVSIECSLGHKYTSNLRMLKEGHGCSQCARALVNRPESEIMSFIQALGFQTVPRCVDAAPGIEIDVYIPELKIGVEYCGIRWHSVEIKTASYDIATLKYFHQNKVKKCAEAGIRLITIFESDYTHNQNFVYEMLTSAIKKVPVPTKDLRYAELSSAISEPRLRFYNRRYEEVSENSPDCKYSVYDCGENV
jgi:hypothetical protein